ncbi:DNA alkylation repair protein [Candidatus Roizmanbacteria bacterium]|nr:DNA alkylation repair protein [Candidatus Roizmanbacteria bacterium]
MNPIIAKLRNELHNNIDEHTKITGQNFFKEKIKLYGIKNALLTKIAKQYDKEILSLEKKEVFALCEELWQSGYIEESFIACHWSYILHKRFEPKDFAVFDKWVNTYVANWASCDSLCNHTVGTFVEIYPAFINNLKTWAHSENRWTKRASAVTLIIPARHGKFLNDIFDIANILLMDNDDLVQKGYGWMLKAASEAHQKEIFEYMMQHKDRMPRTALRYAIEKMPADLKQQVMAK